ncbi:SUMF1/EgtB/PvdO family nonheme iron enzyme [bacterium]|nr:SUMF1/EgtB/PvdO family nonheme iron enzyme [bacterium]
MHLKIKYFTGLFLVLMGTALLAQGTAPLVSSVVAVQRKNSHTVDVTFDVQDGDSDSLYFMIQVSADEGAVFDLPMNTLSNEFGYGFLPGDGKMVSWDAGTDHPEQYGNTYRAKVIAIDAPISQMVYVPSDTFTMGVDGERAESEPAHNVRVSAFWIAAAEVANVQYKRFCDATDYDYPADPIPDYFLEHPDFPVVNVNWFDAINFCNWYSEVNGLEPCYTSGGNCDTTKTGYRLPTEAEWERAARGGIFQNDFMWASNVFEVDSCNYSLYSGVMAGSRQNFSGGKGPLPVASFDKTWYGLHDLIGNISEWCHDWYHTDYYSVSDGQNPMGSAAAENKVVRGGSFESDQTELKVWRRFFKDENEKANSLGFRLVRRAR